MGYYRRLAATKPPPFSQKNKYLIKGVPSESVFQFIVSDMKPRF